MKTNIAQSAARFWRTASFNKLKTLPLLAAGVLGSQLACGQCTPPPSGLVAWWPAEGNCSDLAGGNDGAFVGAASYATGKVNNAWNFQGSSYVTVPTTAALRPPQFTLECWVKPVSTGRPRFSADVDTIVQTYSGSSGYWLGLLQDPTYAYLGFPSPLPQRTICFYVWIPSSGFVPISGPAVPADGLFHHVAASVDDLSMNIYLDGVLAATKARPAGAILHSTLPLSIARSDDVNLRYAAAALDELSFYNRALAPAELASIFAADSAGKCTDWPPNIVLQPQSQSVFWTQSATFTVAATGTKPLAYQWQLQSTNLLAATNASLVIASVGTNQAGSYRVIITNTFGAVTSAVAVLTGSLSPGNWTGGGDGTSWNNAANWSGGLVPGPTNDVVIAGVVTNVTINIASSVTVRSLQCSASLTVSAGTLYLTKGASQVVGYFSVAPGQALSASGTNTTFTATGPATLDYSSLTAQNGAVVTAPAVRSVINGYPYVWEASGLGSRIVLAGVTNIFGNEGYFRLNATAGGRLELPAVTSIANTIPVVLADGSNSVVDLSAVVAFAPPAAIASYPGSLEARNGGAVLVPLWTEAPGMTVILRPDGAIPTAQFTRLGGITLGGMTVSFPVLTNFNDGNITVSGGALSLPALRNFTKNCSGANWSVSGSNSVLDLPALTNITGAACQFPTMQATAGGRLLATNLATIMAAPLTIQADGAGSLVDFRGLRTGAGQGGYLLTIVAQNGGIVSIPQLGDLQSGKLTVVGQAVNLPALTNLADGDIAVSGGGALSLPALRSFTKNCSGANWSVSGSNSVLDLPALTNITGAACQFPTMQATAGGRLLATNLATIMAAPLTIQADGAGSLVDFSGLRECGGTVSYYLAFVAKNGGKLWLSGLQAFRDGSVSFLSAGAGSVVDLTRLSGFVVRNGQGKLEANTGGAILLNDQAWLLANVAINIPPGNPVLPPTLVASSTLTLYGKAWHSYWVEQRDTRFADSPWVFAARVPLTNDFQAFASAPPPNTAFRVWEFVADPAIVDLNHVGDEQVQLVLYGAPPKSFAVQTTNSLDRLPAAWATYGTTGAMTNSFRLFPPFTPTEEKRFYRGKEL